MMTRLYRCDLCGEVVEYIDIARNVYLGLYSKGSVSDAVVTDYNKKKRTFELRYVKESRGYSYNTSTGNGPDMCRKCYMAFTDGFMHYLEHANDGATKEKKE